MKKKVLLIVAMVAMLACMLTITAFAKNNIIKLDTIPTLEEIHANPSAYVSHLDAFDDAAYDGKDKTSVVVLSDLAETPTYYVYPAYYYMPGTSLAVYSHLPTFNSIIEEADSTAFASYTTTNDNYGQGASKHLIRIEVPTHVTAIAATAKFENSSNLLEIYFPVHEVTDPETGITGTKTYITSVSGQNLMSSCSKVEYIHNMEYLPVGIIEGNKDGFVGCNSLKEVKIPEGVTYIPGYFFKNCYALKEVVLPHSIVTLGKQAFCNCSSLESFTFSPNFTTFSRVNSDYETFMGVHSLKFVYMPSTVTDSLSATASDYKNIFNSTTAKTVYFLVGDEAKATAIRDLFKATNANQNIGNADIVAFDPDVDYTVYQAQLTNSVIVYGYSACEAFYDGVHSVSENYTIEYSGQALLSKATKSKACSNCTVKVDKTELEALFECLGYSSNNQGSIIQGFSINSRVKAEYEAVLGKIEFGVIAAGDTRENRDEGADVFALVNYISCDLSKASYDCFDIKITGLEEESYDTYLFFCAYAKFGDECYYINNGLASNVATSTTYNLAK